MATFPDFDYTENGYGWTCEPDSIRTEYASRNSRKRRLFKNRDDLFTVSLKLTAAQLIEFEDFVLDDLDNGADVFTGPFWTYDVERTGDLQILDGRYDVNYLTPDYFGVSYSFYLRDRDFTDDGLIYDLVNAATGFENLYGIMEATDKAINDNEL